MTRHVRTASGVAKWHEPIGTPIVSHRHTTLAGDTPKLKLTSSAPMSSAMDDKVLTKRSQALQHHSQVKAESWYTTVASNTMPGAFWLAYQDPDDYGSINRVLRTGVAERGQTKAHLTSLAKEMFKEAGTKTTQPIVVYRALRSQQDGDRTDWSKKLTVGSTFEDDGMVSTTAQPDFAQGWLMISGKNQSDPALPSNTQKNDVVMEVRVPSGKTVVGGTTQFIETMLPPGSKFKIVASAQRTAKPADPLSGDPAAPFTYTHVIAELQ